MIFCSRFLESFSKAGSGDNLLKEELAQKALLITAFGQSLSQNVLMLTANLKWNA